MASNNRESGHFFVERKSRVNCTKLVAILGCMVVLATAVALMVPALSMTRSDAICGLEEHTHTDACYEQVLVCGLDESDSHEHTDACYETQLTCELPEHEHSADCFASADEGAGSNESADGGGAGVNDGAAVGDDGESGATSAVADADASDAAEDASQSAASAASEGAAADDSASQGSSGDAADEGSAAAAKLDTQSANMPAQEFQADLKDENDDVVLTVAVKAPKGAFPENTFMKIDGIPVEDVQEQVEAALSDAGLNNPEVKQAEAVDITFFNEAGEPVEPAKKIEVKIAAAGLQDAEDPVLVHVAERDEVVKSPDGTATDRDGNPFADAADKYESAEVVKKVKQLDPGSDGPSDTMASLAFKTDEFSPYVIVYTVDFEYAVDGKTYQYSLNGGEAISLSKLVELLGMLDETQFVSTSDFIKEVKDVSFSDEDLVKIVHPEADISVGEAVQNLEVDRQLSASISEEEALAQETATIRGGDWALISIKPFESEETLTITLRDGNVITVKVTDASSVTPNDGIKSLLTNASVTGAKFENGKYVLYPDQPYGIHLTFKEVNKDDGQFPMDSSFTYQLPAGLVPHGASASNYLEITLSGGEHSGETVKLNYTISDSGLITFNWDKNANPDAYDQLKDALYSQFTLDIDCTYTGDSGTLDFGNEITKDVTVKNNGTVNVNKVGKYNATTNSVDYTVTVYSDGITKNVVISDTVSGSALTYNRDAASSTSIYGKEVPAPTSNNNGFTMTVPQMADGETITVHYSAAVNLDALHKNPDGSWGTVEETGNKVTVKSKDNPDVTDENSGKDFENKISMSNIGKSGIPVEADETGHATVSWTIHANDNANVSMAGRTISDSISGNSVPMTYNGNGIHVVAKNADETQAYEKDIQWGNGGLTKSSDGKSWTWAIPNQAPDTQKLSYVITYTTDADVSDRLIKTNVKNHAESDNGGTADQGTEVTPHGGGLTARKKMVKTDLTAKTITWEVSFDVPATGLNSAQIDDTVPAYYNASGQLTAIDNYLGDSTITITPELEGDESYEVSTTTDSNGREHVVVDFYKMDGEQRVTGLSATGNTRRIRVQFQTEIDSDWMQAAIDHPTNHNALYHTNTASVILNGQRIGTSASTKIDGNEPGMSKVHGSRTTYNVNGNSLPAYPYVVTLEGLTDDYFDDSGMLYIEDTFNGKYLAYYLGSQNNTTGDNDLVGYLYGATSYQDLSGGGDPIHNVAGKSANRVVSNPSDGKILISVSRDDIPTDKDGNYYPYYYVYYYLTVKDPIALEKLEEAIQSSDSGSYPLLNTVTNEKFGSASDTAQFEIPVLDKTITSPNGKAYYDNGNWVVDYKIDVNPDALELGDDEELILTDDYTNLAIDYTTIKIQKYESGTLVDTTSEDGVSWNRKGYRVTYTLQNGVHYVITYKARITGEPESDGKVHYSNTAEYFGVKKYSKGDQDISAHGSGSSPTYGITVLKHEKGAGSSPLGGAKFKLYRYTATQDQENGWENQPSNAINVEQRTPVDSGWEEVKDMTTGADGVAKTSHGDSIQRWTWYMLIEQEAPIYKGTERYQLKNNGYLFWITDKGVADYSHYVYLNDDVVAINNEPPIPETVDIGVTKTWEGDTDASKRKDITVRLFADGVPYADWTDKNGNHLVERGDAVKVLPLKADGTTDGYTWEGLPGGPTYSVVEDGVAGYTTSYSPKGTQVSRTINVKNKYIPGKTFIHVEKNWSANIAPEDRAEDITVQLKRKVSPNGTIQFVRNDGLYLYSTTVPAGSVVNISYKEENSQNSRGYTVYAGLGTTGEQLRRVATKWGGSDGSVSIENVEVSAQGITIQFPNDGFEWGNLEHDPIVSIVGSSGEATYSDDVNFNNEQHLYTISAANDWKIDIDRLVQSDDDGEYIYYVEEVGVNDNTQTPEEAGYTVSYSGNNATGIAGGSGNSDNDTIAITNSPKPGSLEVTKLVSGVDAKGTYNIAVKDSTGHYHDLDGADKGAEPFYITFSKDETKKWENLPAGVYAVEEQNAEVDGYTWRVIGAGEVDVPVGDTAQAQVTNIYEEIPQVGSLTITKEVKPADPSETLPAGNYAYNVDITIEKDGKTYHVQNTAGDLDEAMPNPTMKVTAGTPLVIENLPYGTYSVVETTPGSDVVIEHFSYEVVEGESVSSGTATIGPESQNETIALKNLYVKGGAWTPEVTKLVNGKPYAGAEYTFTLTQVGAAYADTAITSAENGKAIFDTITYQNNGIHGTEESFVYQITENKDNPIENIKYDQRTIYAKVTVTKTKGKLTAVGKYYSDVDCTQELVGAPTFDNTELGTLTVQKTVTGDYEATDEDEYPITVKCGDKFVLSTADGNTRTYAGLSDTDPGYKVKAGEANKLTFVDMPVGSYVVTEGDVSKTGYSITSTYSVDDGESTSTGPSVSVAKGAEASVVITNDYKKLTDFEFSKVWNDASSQPAQWPEGAKITVTLNAYTDPETKKPVLEDQVLEFSATTVPDGWSVETGQDGKRKTFKTTGLNATKSGSALTYYVVEAKVDGYNDPSYADTQGNSLTNSDRAINGQQIINTPEGGYELPSTGGSGTTPLMVLGLAIIAGAVIVLLSSRKRPFAQG